MPTTASGLRAGAADGPWATGGWGRAAVLASAVALAAAPVIGRPWAALLSSVCAPLAFVCHLRSAVPARNALVVAALVSLTVLLPTGGWGWPAPLAVLLTVALRPGVRGERGLAQWLRAGSLGWPGISWAGAIAIASGAALVGWSIFTRPDLADLTRGLRGMPLAALLGGGVAWAALNAFGEESIFRGALTDGLEAAFGPRQALAIQAVAFGAAHWHGVPRGVAGVLLATVYGLMLGLLRARTRGLLAPMLAHLFANLVVFSLLVAAA